MRILIASPIDQDAIAKLREQHQVVYAFGKEEEVLQGLVCDSEVLIFRSGVNITAEVMECSPDLKLIIRAGSGIDNVDVAYARHRGLDLVRVPGPGAQAGAEMSFAFMLALSRSLLVADRLTRQGHWAKYELAGYLLTGKVLGIVGAGNIGSTVGSVGEAWGMDVIGCVEHPSAERAARLHEKGIRLASFDEVVSSADYLSLHVPMKDSTRNLIDAQVLSRMKPGAFLINLARGGVVNEQALYQALTKRNGLRGAAVDVHADEGEGKISPFAGLPNVILTPHIGAMAVDSQREIGRRVNELVDAFMRIPLRDGAWRMAVENIGALLETTAGR
jgi:phosphoglycerate dehydrogenase-like enzyme